MTSTVLSIFIQTYNRKESLIKTLDALVGDFCLGISITVIDNNSGDGTFELSNDLRYENVKFIKNKVNIGSTLNYLRCHDLSEGEFTWVICDDDLCDFSGLNKLVSFLSDTNADVVMVGESIVDNKWIHSEDKGLYGKGKAIQNKKFSNLLESNINNIVFNFGFIPSLLYRRLSIRKDVLSLCYLHAESCYPQNIIQYSLGEEKFEVYSKFFVKKPKDYSEVPKILDYQLSWLKMSRLIESEYGFKEVEKIIFPTVGRTFMRMVDASIVNMKHCGKKDTIFKLFEHSIWLPGLRKLIPLMSTLIFILPKGMLQHLQERFWQFRNK